MKLMNTRSKMYAKLHSEHSNLSGLLSFWTLSIVYILKTHKIFKIGAPPPPSLHLRTKTDQVFETLCVF
jgi:hypothetical protein